MFRAKYRWAACALAVSCVASAWADGLPRAQPHAVGFSAERLDHIDRFYADKVNRGEMAGIVILIARHGKIAHFSAIGYANLEKRQKMQTDTIFRLYSMTKPIAATALMMLFEEGRFQLNDPLSKYIPEFANLRVLRTPDSALDDTVPLIRAPTVQDALRHTAGFAYGVGTSTIEEQYKKVNVLSLDITLAEMMSKLGTMPLLYQPGTTFSYSVAADVQARLVEILSGRPFDEFLEQRLFKPLGMRDAGFSSPADRARRLSVLYWIKDGKPAPLDDVHEHPQDLDPRRVDGYTVNHPRKGGTFGLVSTAEDYWRFAQMMLNGGEFNGSRILSPQTVRYMTLDHLGSINPQMSINGMNGLGFGLGFAVIKDPVAVGALSSEGSFLWAGAAATWFWVDPKEDLVVVALTQHLHAPWLVSFLDELRALVYSSLIE